MSQSESPGEDRSSQKPSLRRRVEYAQERVVALGSELRSRGIEPSIPDEISSEQFNGISADVAIEEQLVRDLEGDDAIALQKRLSVLQELISTWEATLDEREQDIHEKFAEAIQTTTDETADDEWSDEAGKRLSVDVGSIATYMSYVINKTETDGEFTETLFEEFVKLLNDHISSEDEIHKASFVLWNILVKHEDQYFDE